MIKKINLYLAKSFCLKFAEILAIFSILGLVINLIEVIKLSQSFNLFISDVFYFSFLKTPKFLDELSLPIILIAGIATFFKLSIRSEIVAIRGSGLSFWQILKPILCVVFIIGVAWSLFFSKINAISITKLAELEDLFEINQVEKNNNQAENIWLRQENFDKKGEEILIRINKANVNNLNFLNISLWFLDKNGLFYQKLDAKSMYLEDEYWILKDLIINSANQINKSLPIMAIKTSISRSFVVNSIRNNFQDVSSFDFFSLPALISEIESVGMSAVKFTARYHNLIAQPFMFIAMILISAFFGIGHSRSAKSFLMLLFGIAIGLLIYIIDGVFNSFASAKMISVFFAVWGGLAIYLSIGILLLFYKEKN